MPPPACPVFFFCVAVPDSTFVNLTRPCCPPNMPGNEQSRDSPLTADLFAKQASNYSASRCPRLRRGLVEERGSRDFGRDRPRRNAVAADVRSPRKTRR